MLINVYTIYGMQIASPQEKLFLFDPYIDCISSKNDKVSYE